MQSKVGQKQFDSAPELSLEFGIGQLVEIRIITE